MPLAHRRRQAGAALETERAARAAAEAKLASALTQIADYEKRLFGRSTQSVVPVDRELRFGATELATL